MKQNFYRPNALPGSQSEVLQHCSDLFEKCRHVRVYFPHFINPILASCLPTVNGWNSEFSLWSPVLLITVFTQQTVSVRVHFRWM